MSGIAITGLFTPAGTGGFPLLSDADLKGGFRVVADNTARDAIPSASRIAGMSVYSIGSTTTYRLVGGITNGDWQVVSTAPSGSAGGDLSGTYPNPTVAKVNGTSYPAGGALTTGTIPRVTGVSTVAYGALDLANTSAVTGALPIANVAPGTNGQILTTASGVPTWGNDLGSNNLTTTGSYFAGTASPDAEQSGSIVTVSTGSTAKRGMISTQHSTGTDGARFLGIKTRGTRASPTTIANGDTITRYVGMAYDGTSYLETASIQSVVNGTVSTGTVPTDLVFLTAASGGTPTERLRIKSDGTLVVGSSAAALGTIRLPFGFGFYSPNQAGSADKKILDFTTANNVIALGPEGATEPNILLHLQSQQGILRSSTNNVMLWNNASVQVVVSQLLFSVASTVAAAGVTSGNGTAMTYQAGNTSDNATNSTGGKSTFTGGLATGNTGGNTYKGGQAVLCGADLSLVTGTQVGGDALVRGGIGDTQGNVAFCVDTTSWQSMQQGIFLGNAVALPSGDPTSGVFVYSDSGKFGMRWATSHTLRFDDTTATTASAGSGGAAPVTVQGYLTLTIDGTARKVPFYAT